MKDIQELLPWYVNGTLEESEKRAVEAYLAEHADAQRDVAFLDAVRRSLQQQTVQSPGDLVLKRLQRQIAQERKAGRRRGWWQPVLAAAAVVVLVQGVLLFSLWREPETTYQPAAGPAQTGAVVQIQFVEDATEQQMRSVIQGVGGSIVDGPGALGVYRVRIKAQPTERDKIKAMVKVLRAHQTIVRHVSED